LEDDLILDNAISQNGKKEKPFVQIRGLTKKFGAITAVDNIDLDIYQGGAILPSWWVWLWQIYVVKNACWF
jgi:hypothetical protein